MDIEKELARFQRDTANHTMEVRLDNGLHRHLTFTENGSSIYRFDLITWPGFLCISGDMGCNVFSRLPDMFEFFRKRDGSINPRYWQEKIEDNGRDSAQEFDPEAFRKLIKAELHQALKSIADEEEAEDLKHDVNSLLLDESDNGEHAAWAAVGLWDDERMPLEDFGENYNTCRDFTVHYIWRCHAIAWGIQQYDQLKATQAVA